MQFILLRVTIGTAANRSGVLYGLPLRGPQTIESGEAMSEEFGGEFITLTDEEGNEFELEYCTTIEYEGTVYMAFLTVTEADEDTEEPEESEDDGLVILKVINVDGEDQLATLDSQEELDAVYELVMQELFEDEEE